MSGEKNISGKCLCGAVTFTAIAPKAAASVCHCTMCQHQVAGPYVAVECTPGSLKISGEENVTAFQSSPWAARSFCKICGSALFWRSADGRFEVVSAGALDDTSGFRLTAEIYIDEKPPYYEFANDTVRLTGAEFMAAVGAVNPNE